MQHIKRNSAHRKVGFIAIIMDTKAFDVVMLYCSECQEGPLL